MNPHRSPLILLVCAVGFALAACGGSSSSSSSSSPAASPSSSSAAPASSASSASAPAGSAAAQEIAANWTAFFNAKTPVAKRISLVQDGQVFASVIKGQAGSGLASEATAKVTKVTITSPTQATVTYSILVGGQPALTDKTGVAVLQGGTWKVGLASFCGLLALENGGKTSGLPSACSAAG
jgi:hypothetical protein